MPPQVGPTVGETDLKSEFFPNGINRIQAICRSIYIQPPNSSSGEWIFFYKASGGAGYRKYSYIDVNLMEGAEGIGK